MNQSCLLLIVFGFLVSCATTPSPPLTADSPASPSALEAKWQPLPNTLGTDGLTRKTQQIFASGGTQDQQPSPTPQPEMGQMPGMKMP
jgi:hypothetical protein